MNKEDLIIQRIDDLKDSTDSRLDSIDANLRAHMRRTEILEKLHHDNQSRIEKLEEPRKALVLIKNAALYIAAIAGAILTIAKVMEL